MIHVHIEASSVADLQSELKALLDGQCSTACDMALNAPKVEAPKTDGENDKEPKVEAPTPDGESDEEPKTDEPAPVKGEADGDPQPTMEETRAALNAYRKKNGIAALKELFAAHGVTNFLDLPATEYAVIMKEVNAGV